MRIGVKQSLVEEAIAAAYDAQPVAVRHAAMLTGSLPEVVAMAATHTLGDARMKLFHPLGVMLASPVSTVEEAMKRFSEEIAVENDTDQQTARALIPGRVSIEDKYDGIRAQLHCGDPGQAGRVELFSRSREDLGESFPELIHAFAAIREPAILDGEVLAWNPPGRPRAALHRTAATPGPKTGHAGDAGGCPRHLHGFRSDLPQWRPVNRAAPRAAPAASRILRRQTCREHPELRCSPANPCSLRLLPMRVLLFRDSCSPAPPIYAPPLNSTAPTATPAPAAMKESCSRRSTASISPASEDSLGSN